MTYDYDRDFVCQSAIGRWSEILHALADLPSECFGATRESPCPICGGNTRWRVYDDFGETGGCRCNQCGNWGTGFEFLAWRLRVTEAEAIDSVGDYLGCQPRELKRKKSVPTTTLSKLPKPNIAASASEKTSDSKSSTQCERIAIVQQLKSVEADRKAAIREEQDLQAFDDRILELKSKLSSLQCLADGLGVSVQSLELLRVSYDFKEGCWGFPEFDSRQEIRCRNRRYEDGAQKVVRGGQRGLTYAPDWQKNPGPVLIVEGLSDTAAGITLELPTIGRPSNKVPKDLLPELVALLKPLDPDRGIVVVGENDQDEEGRWPGRDGASETAKQLNKALNRPVQWGLPPGGVKDLREWLKANPGAPGSDFVESMELEIIGDCRESASDIDPPTVADDFLRLNFKCGGVATLRAYRGSWWRWRGRQWEMWPEDEIRAALTSYLGVNYKHVNRGRIADVIEFVRARTLLPSAVDMPSWLDDRAGYSIAFANGIATLDDLVQSRQECLRHHSPQWFSEVSLPYKYDPDAGCPLWTDMLFKNLEGDCERESLLQEFAGYCLTCSTEYHTMLFLTGDGGNGKSCVLAGLMGMLGRQNVSNLSLNDMGEKFKLPRLNGKLANICADLSETSRACEGTLKKLISGDPLEFEEKYKGSYTAVPTAKLIFSTNSLPRFHDRSGGLWRRVKIMPFNRKVTDSERITGMDSADWWLSKGELPGIFNWALLGLKRLREQAVFSRSEVCHQAIEEHRQECNTAMTWLREEYELQIGASIKKSDIYSAYSQHCKEYGLLPLGMPQFMKELRKAFGDIPESRPRAGGSRERYLVGIAQKADVPASIF